MLIKFNCACLVHCVDSQCCLFERCYCMNKRIHTSWIHLWPILYRLNSLCCFNERFSSFTWRLQSFYTYLHQQVHCGRYTNQVCALYVSGTQAVYKVLLHIVVLQIVNGFVMNSRLVKFYFILSLSFCLTHPLHRFRGSSELYGPGFNSGQDQSFFLHHSFQTGSGAHPVVYAIDTVDPIPGGRAARK